MASDDLLDVDANGMVGEDKGTLSLLQEGREVVRAEVREVGQTWLRAVSTMELGNPQLRKKVDSSEVPLLKLASESGRVIQHGNRPFSPNWSMLTMVP
eukprot:g30516.t1